MSPALAAIHLPWKYHACAGFDDGSSQLLVRDWFSGMEISH
jgi:hypothetical protein